ncbi:MAG: hypothetical protein C5B44_02395, partial [Acidobacteria bacterium]
MARDDRFYAFIIANSSRSRSHIRRICVEKKSLKIFVALTLLVTGCTLYGFYGLLQQARHLRIEMENQSLRAENERQRQELNQLNTRVQAVEDTSRKLAEKSGVVQNETVFPGTGGPALPLDAESLATLEEKMSRLETQMRAHETLLRERGYTPTIWPVLG